MEFMGIAQGVGVHMQYKEANNLKQHKLNRVQYLKTECKNTHTQTHQCLAGKFLPLLLPY